MVRRVVRLRHDAQWSEMRFSQAVELRDRAVELTANGERKYADMVFRAAGHMYEDSGDSEKYVEHAISKYERSYVLYSYLSMHSRARRVQKKQLNMYQQLMEDAQRRDDISEIHRHEMAIKLAKIVLKEHGSLKRIAKLLRGRRTPEEPIPYLF